MAYNLGELYYSIGIDTTDLKKDQKQVERLNKKTRGLITQTQRDLKALQIRASRATNEQALTSINQKIKATEQNLRRLNSLGDKVGRTSSGLGSALSTVGPAIGAVFAADQIASFGKAVLDSTVNAEQFAVAMETMLGSKGEADKLIGEIATFAATTPFELTELQTASKTMLAFGFDAQSIIPELTKLGDVSAGLNQPIGEMAQIFGKVKVAGRVMTEDLNQFTERGVPIWEELAKVTGKNQTELRKFVETGKVGFKEIQQVFTNLTSENGKFAGLMEAQSKTLGGQISNLNDQFEQIRITLGTKLMPVFQAAITVLDQILNSPTLKEYAALWGELFGEIQRIIKALTPANKEFSLMEAILKASVTPAKFLVQQLTYLARGIRVVTEFFSDFGKEGQAATDASNTLGESMIPLSKNVTNAQGAFQGATLSLKNFISQVNQLKKSLGVTISTVFTRTITDLASLKEEMKSLQAERQSIEYGDAAALAAVDRRIAAVQRKIDWYGKSGKAAKKAAKNENQAAFDVMAIAEKQLLAQQELETLKVQQVDRTRQEMIALENRQAQERLALYLKNADRYKKEILADQILIRKNNEESAALSNDQALQDLDTETEILKNKLEVYGNYAESQSYIEALQLQASREVRLMNFENLQDYEAQKEALELLQANKRLELMKSQLTAEQEFEKKSLDAQIEANNAKLANLTQFSDGERAIQEGRRQFSQTLTSGLKALREEDLENAGSIAAALKKIAIESASQAIQSAIARFVAAQLAKNSFSGFAAPAIAAASGVAAKALLTKFTKFATGGVIPEGHNNDTFPSLLSSNEVVLNPKQQANLLFKMANSSQQDAYTSKIYTEQQRTNNLLENRVDVVQVNKSLWLAQNGKLIKEIRL